MVTVLSGINLVETVSRKAHIYSAFIRDPGGARPGRAVVASGPSSGGLEGPWSSGTSALIGDSRWNRHGPLSTFEVHRNLTYDLCPIALGSRGNLPNSVAQIEPTLLPTSELKQRGHKLRCVIDITAAKYPSCVQSSLCLPAYVSSYASPLLHRSPHLCGGLLSILV
jgi:hypothetical protein